MVVKRIQPMRIQSIKASIKVSTDEISKGMSTIIDSSVTSSLESCAGVAKKLYGKLGRDSGFIGWLYE